MITELAYMAVILAERVAEQSSGSSSGVIAAMAGIAAAIAGGTLAVTSKKRKDSGNATKQADAEVPISKADEMRVMALLEALDELNHPDRGDKE